jgi:predicted HTH domain antitoxin
MSNEMITKSIRLTTAEANELARAAEQSTATEAALMKKWVLDGLRAQKVEQAVQAYAQGKVDLRGGASLADVSYNRFLSEVQARRIVILEDPAFLDRLPGLAGLFAGNELQSAIQAVRNASAE